MIQSHYYKIIKKDEISSFEIGYEIDTDECINTFRVNRNKELLNLFELTYKYSKKKKKPVVEVLCQNIYDPHFSGFLLNKIKKESIRSSFSREHDLSLFIDFILEKARILVNKEYSKSLPPRFESCFFWENIDDCKSYCNKFSTNGPFIILKVSFIEKIQFERLDNILISTQFYDWFTSEDFLNQAKIFLLGGESNEPHFEIIFQGRFKIIEHIILK